jgi:hypothetical protein
VRARGWKSECTRVLQLSNAHSRLLATPTYPTMPIHTSGLFGPVSDFTSSVVDYLLRHANPRGLCRSHTPERGRVHVGRVKTPCARWLVWLIELGMYIHRGAAGIISDTFPIYGRARSPYIVIASVAGLVRFAPLSALTAKALSCGSSAALAPSFSHPMYTELWRFRGTHTHGGRWDSCCWRRSSPRARWASGRC